MTRSRKRILSAAWSAAAVTCLLCCGSASAQSILGGGGGGNARAQTAYSDWRRLSQNEIDCVIDRLRGQRSSLQAVIQRGIGPNDAAMAQIRAACRSGARSANSRPTAERSAHALAAVDSRADEASRRAAAERRAAELAAEKALAEKVAAEVAAAKKAAAERLAAEQAAAERAAEEKAAAERLAAEQAAAAKAVSDKKAEDEAKARRAQTERLAAAPAKTDAERPAQEPLQPPQPDEHPSHDPTRMPADAANAYAAAELRNSFIYGLLCGPFIFCLGGAVFMLIGRRRSARADQIKSVEALVIDTLERRYGAVGPRAAV
jgi:hypothetical protein